jgi:hypothetical protein
MRQRRPSARNRHQPFRLALAGRNKNAVCDAHSSNSDADAMSSRTISDALEPLRALNFVQEMTQGVKPSLGSGVLSPLT